MNPEIFEKSSLINARTYTMFANALSGITNFDTPDSLAMISLIAKGCFGDDDAVSGMLVTFIHNHLDKLITPDQILKKDWDYVRKSLHDVIYQGGNYRADIASVLTIRFINYVDRYFKSKDDDDKKKSELVSNRVIELVMDPDKLLTEDLILKLIKTLFKQNPVRFSKLLANPRLKSKLLSN